MPSSDTNLHHLTTKGPLLISKAHSAWLTAWHAEGIREKECGGEGRPARITHTHTPQHKHLSTFSHQHRYTFVLGRMNQVAHMSSLFHAEKAFVRAE